MMLVGFFRELPHGYASQPALADVTGGFSGDRAALAGFLDSCGDLVVADAVAYDVLSADRTPIGGLSIKTDGVAVWPSDLGYYLRTYGVALPEEFVRSVAEQGYAPPALSREDWARVEDEFIAAAGAA